MLWDRFHLEPNVERANIECLGNAARGLRFKVDNLLKDMDNEEMVFGVSALPVTDVWEREVAVVVWFGG